MIENKCPKCGEKLSVFYLKQECPKCKTNLLYYDLENRLKEDNLKAEAEVAAVNKFLNKLKLSSVGGPLQIIRLVLLFTPLLWMLLPVFKGNEHSFTLLNVILGIINGSLGIDTITGDKAYLFPVLTIVCVIVFSLAVIISSLFSCTKKALLRNMILSLVNIAVLSALTVLSAKQGLTVGTGLYITFAEYIITFAMHVLCDKTIKSKSEVN